MMSLVYTFMKLCMAGVFSWQGIWPICASQPTGVRQLDHHVEHSQRAAASARIQFQVFVALHGKKFARNRREFARVNIVALRFWHQNGGETQCDQRASQDDALGAARRYQRDRFTIFVFGK